MVPELSAYLPPPDETDLQRVRRRLQQRRCLGCGSRDRVPRSHMCAACAEKVQYCNRCEQVKDKAEFRRPSDWCYACCLERKRKGVDLDQARREAAAKGHATLTARRRETSGKIAYLRDDLGWKWAAIDKAMGMSRGCARSRYQRHKAAERNRVEER